LDKPLPYDLIREIVMYRLDENERNHQEKLIKKKK
jgi:hypothetical protein